MDCPLTSRVVHSYDFSTACPHCTNTTLHQGVGLIKQTAELSNQPDNVLSILDVSLPVQQYIELHNRQLQYSTAKSTLHSCKVLESVLYIYRCLVSNTLLLTTSSSMVSIRKAAVSQIAATHHVKQFESQAQLHLLDAQPIDGQSPSLSTYQMGRPTLTSCSYALVPCHMSQLIIIY